MVAVRYVLNFAKFYFSTYFTVGTPYIALKNWSYYFSIKHLKNIMNVACKTLGLFIASECTRSNAKYFAAELLLENRLSDRNKLALKKKAEKNGTIS